MGPVQGILKGPRWKIQLFFIPNPYPFSPLCPETSQTMCQAKRSWYAYPQSDLVNSNYGMNEMKRAGHRRKYSQIWKVASSSPHEHSSALLFNIQSAFCFLFCSGSTTFSLWCFFLFSHLCLVPAPVANTDYLSTCLLLFSTNPLSNGLLSFLTSFAETGSNPVYPPPLQ